MSMKENRKWYSMALDWAKNHCKKDDYACEDVSKRFVFVVDMIGGKFHLIENPYSHTEEGYDGYTNSPYAVAAWIAYGIKPDVLLNINGIYHD